MKMRKKQTLIISCIRKSIAILAVLLLAMASLPVASADDWSYRKPITIYGSQVQGTMTNFPVPIYQESDPELAASAQPDGGDIVFTNAANTVRYDHEIEKFVKSTGKLVAWVEIDSLSSGSNTTIYMWYGNPTCANQWNIEGTWNPNYKLVQHLNESCASSGCIKDSTSNNNDGTPYSGGSITNLYTSSGKMNGADSFDGSNDYVDIGDLGVGNSYTAECWIKADTLTGTGDHNTYGFTIMASSSSSGHYPLWLTVRGTEVRLWAYESSATGYHQTTGAGLTTTDWFYVVATAIKSGATKVYVNGIEKLSFTNDGEKDWTSIYTIGDLRPNRHICFDGVMDEVRISATIRDGDWIKTSYNNQNNPSTFYNVGGQQNAGPAPPVPDLPAIILFGAGLLVIVLYAVPRRRSRK